MSNEGEPKNHNKAKHLAEAAGGAAVAASILFFGVRGLLHRREGYKAKQAGQEPALSDVL